MSTSPHVDVIALISTSQAGIDAFMAQPHLPKTTPVHAFLLPRRKVPVRNDKTGDTEWKSAWFRGRDPHSTAVGEAHKHALRSMLALYPMARSVTVFEDDARLREGGVGTIEAGVAWIDANDDAWDLFYWGHYPGSPTERVAPSVVRTPTPIAAHAVAYHRRIIPEVLKWDFRLMGIDERIAFFTPKWRKFAAYPDVFYQIREPGMSALVRTLWPNIIGLPFVRTYDHRVFADDLNHLMLRQSALWPLVMAWTISLGLAVTWVALFCRAFRRPHNMTS